MKELIIYEAGKMAGLTYDEMNKWRSEFADRVYDEAAFTNCDVSVVNPVNYFHFENPPKYQTQAEVMDFDLNRVKNSDLIVVNMNGLNTSDGTKIELYEAWKSHIPVLAFGKKKTYRKLHPWIKRVITRHDESMVDTVKYIKEFYLS